MEWATTFGQTGVSCGVAGTGRVQPHGTIPRDADGETVAENMRITGRNVRRGSANTCALKWQHEDHNRTRVNRSRNGAKARSGREAMGLGVGRHDGGRCECWATAVVAGWVDGVDLRRKNLSGCDGRAVRGPDGGWDSALGRWCRWWRVGGDAPPPRKGQGHYAVSGAECEMGSKPELSRKMT